MYEIIVSNQAKKQLSELSSKIRNEIGSALERIVIRPHKFVKRLRNSPYYKLNVSDYRVILDVRDTALILMVIGVKQRGNVYKKRIS